MARDDILFLDLSLSSSQLNELIEGASQRYLAFVEPQGEYADGHFDALAAALDGGRFARCRMACGALHSERGPLTLEASFPDNTTILDAGEDLTEALLYPYGLLCESAALRESGVRFASGLEWTRDELFALQLSAAEPRRAFLPQLVYRSPRTFDELSPSAPQTRQAGWYWECTRALPDGLLGRGAPAGTLSGQAQYGVLYLLLQRFKANQGSEFKRALANVEETARFIEESGRALRLVSDDVLFCNAPALRWDKIKLLYLARLRNPGHALAYRVEAGKTNARLYLDGAGPGEHIATLSAYRATVQKLRFRTAQDGARILDVDFRMTPVFPPESFELHFVNEYDGEEHDCTARAVERTAGLVTFFGQEAIRYPGQRVEIPLAAHACTQKIRAYGLVEDTRVALRIAFWQSWQTRLVTNEPHAYWAADGYLARSVEDAIVLEPARGNAEAKAERDYLKFLAKSADVEDWVSELRREYQRSAQTFAGRRIWAYAEKGTGSLGMSNAESAFRYAAALEDGIEHVYFADPSSLRAAALAQEGFRVCDPSSAEGRLLALHTEVVFAADFPPYADLGFDAEHMEHFKGLVNARIVRMHNGFPGAKSIIHTQAYADYAAVVASSRYEAELYTSPENGYAPEQVIRTSNPRCDALVSNPRKQILIAPTWRPDAQAAATADGDEEAAYNPAFIETALYACTAQVIENPRLLEAARAHGYRIALYLERRLAPQAGDFACNDVVFTIDGAESRGISTALCESALMVSDYSWTLFDFAYLRKPVVYYQNAVLPPVRDTGFDYAEDGLGEVCTSAEALVDVLCEYMEAGCELKPAYRERVEGFFFDSDRNGAKRLYEAVRELVG